MSQEIKLELLEKYIKERMVDLEDIEAINVLVSIGFVIKKISNKGGIVTAETTRMGLKLIK